ncbi:hypothetical protein [sulfur-oxidizing endosymbiont of Gigantopelta aegis]|uniref:hypothetical protein n=1 Tax=sulfur-oxidizing endosymbiont of Gigantopelta aegis TaxID=2794934 RepID=UPI0018DD2CCA|nr:hypothetical protein [sulfur-oxidizing endosymbiont of Gigantopelta aegis]
MKTTCIDYSEKLPPIPEIPEEEKTPVVRLLLAFMEQQQEIIQNQQVEIDALKTEVAKLKSYLQSLK